MSSYKTVWKKAKMFIPVTDENLEWFRGKPHAFTDEHIEVLVELSDYEKEIIKHELYTVKRWEQWVLDDVPGEYINLIE